MYSGLFSFFSFLDFFFFLLFCLPVVINYGTNTWNSWGETKVSDKDHRSPELQRFCSFEKSKRVYTRRGQKGSIFSYIMYRKVVYYYISILGARMCVLCVLRRNLSKRYKRKYKRYGRKYTTSRIFALPQSCRSASKV